MHPFNGRLLGIAGNKLVTSYDKMTQRHQPERGGQTQRLQPISMTHYRRQICRVRKSISGCQVLGVGRVDGHQRSLRGCFWSDGNIMLISAVLQGCVKVLVAQSCPTLCDPMDPMCPPGSSVHGILQARILEWGAIPFSRGPS